MIPQPREGEKYAQDARTGTCRANKIPGAEPDRGIPRESAKNAAVIPTALEKIHGSIRGAKFPTGESYRVKAA